MSTAYVGDRCCRLCRHGLERNDDLAQDLGVVGSADAVDSESPVSGRQKFGQRFSPELNLGLSRSTSLTSYYSYSGHWRSSKQSLLASRRTTSSERTLAHVRVLSREHVWRLLSSSESKLPITTIVVAEAVQLNVEKVFVVIGGGGLGLLTYGLIWRKPRKGVEPIPFYAVRFQRSARDIRRGVIFAVIGWVGAGLAYLAPMVVGLF
jgi:hypothetical protein